MKITKILIILIGFLILSCKQDGTYVELDGKKITEKDLEQTMPQQYQQLRKQYEEKIKELLVELAYQKMFEKEAKEKNLTLDEYMQNIQKNSDNPTQEEIDDFYKKMVESGQVRNNENIEELKFRISNYLKQGKIQEAYSKEIARLKQKFKYKEPYERFQVNIDNEPYRGNKDAKVVIVEFSDFECPYCLKSQSTSKALREKYKDKIKWVFKDFPLDFHENAMQAHIAASCVFRLKPEKFWEYFDNLFSENRTKKDFEKESLEKKAVALGISKTDFNNCLKNPEIKNEIQEDIREGTEISVTGTPAFFINGRKLSGAVPISEFETIIIEELAN